VVERLMPMNQVEVSAFRRHQRPDLLQRGAVIRFGLDRPDFPIVSSLLQMVCASILGRSRSVTEARNGA